MDMLADALNFTGTTVLLRFHWFWMLVALGLGAWVGWRTGGEGGGGPARRASPEDAP